MSMFLYSPATSPFRGEIPPKLWLILQPQLEWVGAYTTAREGSSSVLLFNAFPEEVQKAILGVLHNSDWHQAEVYTFEGYYFVFGSNTRTSRMKHLAYPDAIRDTLAEQLIAGAKTIQKGWWPYRMVPKGERAARFILLPLLSAVVFYWAYILWMLYTLSSSLPWLVVASIAFATACAALYASVGHPLWRWYRLKGALREYNISMWVRPVTA